jgi:3-deoxy-D-manno-octulosonic acid (KDO) 8-phosphate synthase
VGRLLDAHQARALSSRRSDPERALSDGPNMVPVREMKSLLRTLMAFDKLTKA